MAAPSGSPFGAFGQDRRSFEASHFVSWFAMAADEASADQYRPSGEAFHAMVRLDLVEDGQGLLHSLRLFIGQHMLTDPRQEPFARDIAKSFLLDLGEGKDRALDGIAQEIMQRDLASPVLMRGTAPAFAEPASLAFQAFTGAIPGHRIDRPGLRITIERIGELTIMAERIALPPRPVRRSFIARLRDRLFPR